MTKHEQAKRLYIEGRSITDIATSLNVSRTAIYSYKKNDFNKGANWDELRFIKATDATDAQRNEEDFLALLIFNFEQALQKLNDNEPADQVAILSKYATMYYKLKQQKDNPKINKTSIVKSVLHSISDIALAKEDHAVIAFLSSNADHIIKAAIES